MDSYRKRNLEVIVANIKALRKKKGWTQNDLAEKTGFSVGSIRSIESFQRYPRPETLDALANSFGVRADEITNAQGSVDDVVNKVIERFEKMKTVFPTSAVAPHLTRLVEKLGRLDPKRHAAFFRSIEALVDSQISPSEAETLRKPKRA